MGHGLAARHLLGSSLALAFAAAIACPPPGVAQEASSAASSQIRESEHLATTALGRDLLYAVYLPPGYGAAGRRFPTLYLLHGLKGDRLDWLRRGHLRTTLDALIGDGRLAPMIVVMPDGGDSWYVDSAAIGGPGDYAAAIAGDLVAHVDATLASKPEARFRGIAGNSMGGFGAVRLAFQQPFRFAAAAAFSGAFWMRVQKGSVPDAHAERIFNGAFGTPFSAERFLSLSPAGMLDGLAGAKDPPPVFLTVGDDDRFGLYSDSFQLFQRMRSRGLPVEMRMTDGDHEWETWAAELPEALLFFDRQFRRGG